MDYGIKAQERGRDVHYFVNWSPLAMADRWTINAKVPALAGIYEIYWMDDHEHLRMLSVGCTHYGGLRSEIRRLTDPELVDDPSAKKILEEEKIWFRYAPSNSTSAMEDVVWFFMATYFPENPRVGHSGRYEKIYMNESAPNKLIWVP
jgi:glutamate racemase